MIILNKKIIVFITLLYVLNSCVSLPGINKNPKSQKQSENINKYEYSINDVGINIIDLNSLSDFEIKKYNNDKIEQENSLMVSAEGEIAFFASNRHGGYGGLDIYHFILPEHLRPIKTLYFEGIVYDSKTKLPILAKHFSRSRCN